MIFVGIDVIGDWPTEINVTSPTGIQEIDRFDGISIAVIWDRIEARRGAAKSSPVTLAFLRTMAAAMSRNATTRIRYSQTSLTSGWCTIATNIWFNASSQNAAVNARKKPSPLRTQNRAKNSPLAKNPAVTIPARNMLTAGSLIRLPR
jgi:hypothetical protein